MGGWSGGEAEKVALAVPFEGRFADAHEAPGRELDRLTPGEDGLDDIGRQEGKLDGATYLAGAPDLRVTTRLLLEDGIQ